MRDLLFRGQNAAQYKKGEMKMKNNVIRSGDPQAVEKLKAIVIVYPKPIERSEATC